MGDPGSVIVGRRASDGDAISFREAVRMFASKEEIMGLNTAIIQIGARLDTLPVRQELEVHWKNEERFREEMQGRFNEIGQNFKDQNTKISEARDEAKAGRIPQWVFIVLGPTIATVASILLRH